MGAIFRNMLKKALVILTTLFVVCCKSYQPKATWVQYSGSTMGTTYNIKLLDSLSNISQQQIDSVLSAFNQEVSTYIPTSTISIYNSDSSGLKNHAVKKDFSQVFLLSKEIHKASDGYFNHQIMPIVNYWGFGYQQKKNIAVKDSSNFKKLLASVRDFQDDFTKKTNPTVQFDFSAIAKGYGVDLLADFFASKKINRFVIEIGGETRAKGKNESGALWTIGINTPKEEADIRDFYQVIAISDASIATSGNYRNFYELDGQKYAHTINPFSGKPELSNLLSVSVIVPSHRYPCAVADGWATAFMAMGLEKSKEKSKDLPYLEAMFIYSDENGQLKHYYTPEYHQYVVHPPSQ